MEKSILKDEYAHDQNKASVESGIKNDSLFQIQ